MDNVMTVQSIYEAFGKGDVPGILSQVSSDTSWGYNGALAEVPWHGPFNSKEELPRFFQAMAANINVEKFEARRFIAQGDEVIAHIAIAYTVKKTGKRVDEEQLHWWSLRDGKVTRMVHFEDTAQVAAALRA